MDLSTMLKKVKNRVYENKAQFAADLNLIWDNCLVYNSEPVRPVIHSTYGQVFMVL
jgi:transcriptional activator SPT7